MQNHRLLYVELLVCEWGVANALCVLVFVSHAARSQKIGLFINHSGQQWYQGPLWVSNFADSETIWQVTLGGPPRLRGWGFARSFGSKAMAVSSSANISCCRYSQFLDIFSLLKDRLQSFSASSASGCALISRNLGHPDSSRRMRWNFFSFASNIRMVPCNLMTHLGGMHSGRLSKIGKPSKFTCNRDLLFGPCAYPRQSFIASLLAFGGSVPTYS